MSSSDAPSVTDDAAAIRRVVEDYLRGWFEGDRARVERAGHAELCKRSFGGSGPDARPALKTLSRSDLLRTTAEGLGKKRLADAGGDARLTIEIHDVYQDIANVTARSSVYREYLQLARTDDGWKIVNILWCFDVR